MIKPCQNLGIVNLSKTLVHKKGPTARPKPSGVLALGVDLADWKEEAFVRMVCDGLSLGEAFARAGFTSKMASAPSNLWALDRCQQRAGVILEARANQAAVTLPEVTSMLQRVFSQAVNSEQLNAAHNAAFSLARLYGHVTDRASVEVIRRPSRDPDAPSEQALASWVSSLPGQTIEARKLDGPAPTGEAGKGPIYEARAVPLSQDPSVNLNDINKLALFEGSSPQSPNGVQIPSGLQGPGLDREKPNEINWLDGDGTGVGAASENGAPSRPVTGTPAAGARSKPLSGHPHPGASSKPLSGHTKAPPRAPGNKKKGAPQKTKRVPWAKKIKKIKLTPRIPSAKDLFG